MNIQENTVEPIVIYQSADGSIATEVRLQGENVWLSQKQMAELFDKDVRTINEHVINAFEEGELVRESTNRDFRIVRQEGQLDEPAVIRNLRITAGDGKDYDAADYNLDAKIDRFRLQRSRCMLQSDYFNCSSSCLICACRSGSSVWMVFQIIS